MNSLTKWIAYGLTDEHSRKQALVRRWIREARERRPIIDRVNYPDERRAVRRG